MENQVGTTLPTGTAWLVGTSCDTGNMWWHAHVLQLSYGLQHSETFPKSLEALDEFFKWYDFPFETFTDFYWTAEAKMTHKNIVYNKKKMPCASNKSIQTRLMSRKLCDIQEKLER